MKKIFKNIGILIACTIVFAACNRDEQEDFSFEFLSFEHNLLLHYYIDLGGASANIEYTIFNAYVEGSRMQRLLTMADGTQLIEILEVLDGFLVNTVHFNSMQSWFSPYTNMIGLPHNTRQVILPQNLEMGTRWVANPDGADEQIIREVTGIDVEVITSAGSFTTIEVTTFFPYDENFVTQPFTRTYFEPNLGIVKDVRHEGVSFNDYWNGIEEAVIISTLVAIEHNGLTRGFYLFYPHATNESGFHAIDVNFTTNNDLLYIYNNAFRHAALDIFGRDLTNDAINSIFLNQNNGNLVVDISQELADAIATVQTKEEERRILTAIVETLGNIYNAVGVTISVEGAGYAGPFVEIRLMEFWEVGAIWGASSPSETNEDIDGQMIQYALDIARQLHDAYLKQHDITEIFLQSFIEEGNLEIWTWSEDFLNPVVEWITDNLFAIQFEDAVVFFENTQYGWRVGYIL
ncbi:MAG: hypothetical protein FWE44_06095 [Defluviitaleaceae bacterium]|nr:hypothetical protein [Defluviitaleaceae bacterium]